MIYHIEAVNKNDSLEKYIAFESDKSMNDNYKVCDKLITYVDFSAEELVIPEGVTMLCNDVFFDDEIDVMEIYATDLSLPKSLTTIENNAFVLACFSKITIDCDNKSFIVHEGGLYSVDLKRLIYVLTPPIYERAEFWIPEGTESVDGSVLTEQIKIHFPASVTKIGEPEFCDDAYIVAPKDSYAIKFAIEQEIEYRIEGQ